MGLSSTDYALLMMIMALGTYFQTVTGFGLAMIVIGLSSGLGLGNIPLLATVVSIITLANSAIALRHHHHHIQWRIFWVVLAAVLPASIIGVMLLDFLNHQAKNLLALLLGLLIIYSGVIFSLKPQKKPSLDGSPRFFWLWFFCRPLRRAFWHARSTHYFSDVSTAFAPDCHPQHVAVDLCHDRPNSHPL